MANMESRHWALMITELRRFPQMCYKSEITVLSGLDEGDMAAIDKVFKEVDLRCQLDKDDGRFVLKGPAFNPLVVINALTEHRGYKIEYNPQQHHIPLKQGNLDDKFAMIYHLSKPGKVKGHHHHQSNTSLANIPKEPVPPPRQDSLPEEMKKSLDLT